VCCIIILVTIVIIVTTTIIITVVVRLFRLGGRSPVYCRRAKAASGKGRASMLWSSSDKYAILLSPLNAPGLAPNLFVESPQPTYMQSCSVVSNNSPHSRHECKIVVSWCLVTDSSDCTAKSCCNNGSTHHPPPVI